MTSNIPAFWFVQWFSLSICRGSESFTLGNKAGSQVCPFEFFSPPSAGGSWDGTTDKSAAPEHRAHWYMHDLCPSDPQSENGRILVCPRDETSAILFQFQVAKEQITESPHPLDLSHHPQLSPVDSPCMTLLPTPHSCVLFPLQDLCFPPSSFSPASVYPSYLKICSLMPSPLLHRVSGSFPSF